MYHVRKRVLQLADVLVVIDVDSLYVFLAMKLRIRNRYF